MNPFHYLSYIFEKLPNIDTKDKKALDQLLPWSDSLPISCRVKSKLKELSPHLDIVEVGFILRLPLFHKMT
ncbi:hypothetical protein JCM17380_32250 [Desulfosporosinus burensis]